jgi:hypothetical protein
MPWVVAACVEAALISLLVWSLVGEARTIPTVPASPGSAAGPGRADAADLTSSPAAPPALATPPAALPDSGSAVGEPPMAGGLVHGVVRMAGGERLPPHLVLSLSDESGKGHAQSTLSSGIDAFAWADVPAGAYELRVRAEAVRATTMPVHVPANREAVFVDVVLEPSWLVKVLVTTPDGRPLHEVLTHEEAQRLGLPVFFESNVIALWQPVPDELPPSELRASPLSVARWLPSQGLRGRPRALPARYAGELDMPERRDAHVAVLLRDAVLARAAVAAGQDEVELVVDPARIPEHFATLRFELVRPDGTPLAGASVRLADMQSSGDDTKLDEEGRFVRSGLLPGQHTVSCHEAGHALPSFSVVLRPRSVVDLGRLVVQPLRERTFRFTGATGDGLSASLTPLDPLPHAATVWRNMRLHVSAQEANVSLVDGRYLLRVSRGAGAVQEVEVRGPGHAPIDVALVPEAPLHFDLTALTDPTRLVVTTSAGHPVYDRWIASRGRWDLPLPAGSYRVTATPLVGEPRVQVIELPEAGAKFVW